jgi:MerR family transcriptional regulator/heat shock protein HspR
LARDLGVNISGIAIILQMRERMDVMQQQMQEFVSYIQEEVMRRANVAVDPRRGAIVPIRRVIQTPPTTRDRKR